MTPIRNNLFLMLIGETMCIPSSKGRRERYFKQINGIIYEITYDTPPDE